MRRVQRDGGVVEEPRGAVGQVGRDDQQPRRGDAHAIQIDRTGDQLRAVAPGRAGAGAVERQQRQPARKQSGEEHRRAAGRRPARAVTVFQSVSSRSRRPSASMAAVKAPADEPATSRTGAPRSTSADGGAGFPGALGAAPGEHQRQRWRRAAPAPARRPQPPTPGSRGPASGRAVSAAALATTTAPSTHQEGDGLVPARRLAEIEPGEGHEHRDGDDFLQDLAAPR